jgi:hypothetical protein
MDANTSLRYNVMTKHEFGRWEDEMVDKTLFDGRVNFRVDGLMWGPATPYYEIYSSHYQQYSLFRV